MRAKFIVLLLAEGLCLAFLLGLINTPFTLRTAIAGSAFHREPTEANRRRYEEARDQDQQNLAVQRVLFGLALILTTSLLWRTAAQMKKSRAQPNTPPNGGPAARLGNSGAAEGPPSVS
jgi:hypothetical protein